MFNFCVVGTYLVYGAVWRLTLASWEFVAGALVDSGYFLIETYSVFVFFVRKPTLISYFFNKNDTDFKFLNQFFSYFVIFDQNIGRVFTYSFG